MGERSKKIIEDTKDRVTEDFSQLEIKITVSFDDFLA